MKRGCGQGGICLTSNEPKDNGTRATCLYSRLPGQVGKLSQNGLCSKVPLELNLIVNRIGRDNGLLSLSIAIYEV